MPARPRQQEPILASTSISIEEKLEQIEANRKARRTAGSKDVSKSAVRIDNRKMFDSHDLFLHI